MTNTENTAVEAAVALVNVEAAPKTAKASKTAKRGRGRPAAFETKKAIVAVLKNEADVSYYHKRQLVAQGYVVAVPVVVADRGRGRPAFTYEATKKGENLLRLAKNWGSVKKTVVVTTEALDHIVMDVANINFDPVGEAVYA